MEQRVIYLAAPQAVRETDRYETYYYLLSHHFRGAELLEARELFPTAKVWFAGWKDVLSRIDTLVFIRNSDHAVGRGTWKEIQQTHLAGKTVLMARTNKDGVLKLVPFSKLRYDFDKESKQNFAVVTYKNIDLPDQAAKQVARAS